MQKIFFWYCLATLALVASLAGCGGGNSSSPTIIGGDTVTLTVTDQTGTAMDPAYLAFQDGSSAWQKVELNGSGHYTFTLTNPAKKYGIALVEKAEYNDTRLLYATTGELAEIHYTIRRSTSDPQYTISGTVSGVDYALGRISCGSGGTFALNNEYALINVRAGEHQLIATRQPMAAQIPDKMWVKNITLNGDLTQNIDFNDPDNAFSLDSKTITIPTGFTGNVDMVTQDEHSTTHMGSSDDSATFVHAAVPAEKMPSGALYHLQFDDGRSFYESYSSNTQDITGTGVTFPTLGNTTVNDAKTAVSWAVCSPAKIYGMWIIGGSSHTWVYATKNWLGSHPSITLPNLSALEGWNSLWLPGTIDFHYVQALIPNCPLEQYIDQALSWEYQDGYTNKCVYYDGPAPMMSINMKNDGTAPRPSYRRGISE